MNLESYYRINFSLQYFHKWSISMVESWTPYERDIYITLISNQIEEEKQKESKSDI